MTNTGLAPDATFVKKSDFLLFPMEWTKALQLQLLMMLMSPYRWSSPVSSSGSFFLYN